jgi:hypothetical protein
MDDFIENLAKIMLPHHVGTTLSQLLDRPPLPDSNAYHLPLLTEFSMKQIPLLVVIPI